jgi:hypothetical protein
MHLRLGAWGMSSPLCVPTGFFREVEMQLRYSSTGERDSFPKLRTLCTERPTRLFEIVILCLEKTSIGLFEAMLIPRMTPSRRQTNYVAIARIAERGFQFLSVF